MTEVTIILPDWLLALLALSMLINAITGAALAWTNIRLHKLRLRGYEDGKS